MRKKKKAKNNLAFRFNLLKKYWLYILIVVVIRVLLTLFWEENPLKDTTIILLLLFWLIGGLATGKFIQISLLFIFLVLPFNITAQLPESVQILNSEIVISNPYVGGLWVNYLVPTLSILDMFVFLFLVSLLKEEKERILSVLKIKYLWIFGIFIILQYLYVQEILVLFQSVHLFIYIPTALLVKDILKKKKYFQKLLQSSYTNISIIVLVLIQGLIGIYQFVRGASLGVSFLGESNLVSGMSGSSFIDINGTSFLRSYGTFPHPNIFAGWLILMLVISWYSYTTSKNKTLSLISGILILLLSILTFSRLSILLILVITVVWLYTFIKGKKYTFSISNILFVRFLNLFSGEDSSFSDRIQLIRTNWSIFKENFFTGTGLGNSLRYYTDRIPYTTEGKLLLQPVHNIFILSIVELGILGGIYFWFMHFMLFIKGTKWNIKKFVIFLVLISIGLFDHYLLSLPQGIMIFYLFLILLAY